MFTDVVSAHQPHHFHTSSRSHRQNPIDNAFASPVRPRTARPTHQACTERGGNRQTASQPQRYVAHPIQRPLAFSTQPSYADLESASHDDAEHMLRRKTPNGTLAAGYDGDPKDLDVKPHAMKHLLMPRSYEFDTIRNQFEAPKAHTDPLLPSQLDQSYMAQSFDGRRHARHAGYPNQIRSVKFTSANGSAAYQAQGVDSVLDQGLFSQHNLGLANGQHVPTVLQPMWPPCVGLTSMNNTGPYGPYWPDGVYEPYWPAPLTDPRYCPQNRAGSIKDMNGALTGTTRLAGHEPGRDYQNQECRGRVDHNLSYLDSRPYSEMGRTHQRGLFSSQPQPVTSVLHNGYSATSQGLSSPQIERRSQNRYGVHHLDRALHGVSAQPADEGNSAQFKEKILTWAHRIYVSLLSAINNSRRSESNSQHQGERYFPSNLYPKPPRQPYFQSCIETMQVPTSKGKGQGLMLESSLETPSTRAFSHHTSHLQRPTDNAYGAALDPQSTQSAGGKTWTQPLQNGKRQSASTRTGQTQSSPFYNYPYKHSNLGGNVGPQQDQLPAAAASNAIEMLSRLCSESGWKWTDGMLLGGCLAYGLGDLTRALKWYCKVLNCDPNNVEAISNLAATLLALGRRDEAEQQWRRSIKLRPSYFEAVEHLVGLFCEDRRGKEAVKIIEFVQRALRFPRSQGLVQSSDYSTESGSEGSLSPDNGISEKSDFETSDFETQDVRHARFVSPARVLKFSSGYAIPAYDNGRMLALVHGKGNMLYALGDNMGASKAFEDAILIASGRRQLGIHGLIRKILKVFAVHDRLDRLLAQSNPAIDEPILLLPEVALETSQLVFPPHGQLPGLAEVANGIPKKAAISIISNSLLSLAKIYQDGMSSSGATATGPRATSGVQDILALYYLSLSLQPSPSTANNVGILLASVQQSSRARARMRLGKADIPMIPGVVPGSGVALALAYYNYGLILDSRHAHLYTNLGSLFKDIGQLDAAIKMYEKAVECDSKFDIALANLANAVKDKGRISDAISYYRKAVSSNPDFAEAVCGLANALNSVCSWAGRGGIRVPGASRDRWHVDDQGMLYDARQSLSSNMGWIGRVVAIVDKQLREGESWGKGVMHSVDVDRLLQQVTYDKDSTDKDGQNRTALIQALRSWVGRPWEGAKIVRLIERVTKRLGWQFYRRKHVEGKRCAVSDFLRPHMPPILAIPSAPTVLPFHTFTSPLSAKQIRQISQRNGLRISCSTLRAPWLPAHIYESPKPPSPQLNVGYVSSDFNNHPLAHLMQSVFGFHDRKRVKAFCYATTTSDNSTHRQQIEREAPVFLDTSSWPTDRLVKQIVADGIHILVNLNGYTRGARNEVFAARPAPIQMSFMGFAGTLGAEWCDYLLADQIAIPPSTLRPNRCNVDLVSQTEDGNNDNEDDHWVYGENIIFTKDTFFCCDHRQSAPDAQEAQLSWYDEQKRRWRMRKELFPSLSDDCIILGNFNQLYKIEPTTFRTWLRILSRLPKAILWLLRFPDLGETNLRRLAVDWVGKDVAERIVFTDVAPKSQHIARARICDLFLDTPECNAHTTAADVLWSGTPLLTLPRYEYKMCSRMAASILAGALPKTAEGDRAAKELIAKNDDDYEERAVELGCGLVYPVRPSMQGFGKGRLVELRKLLYENRRTSALFDTRRWVSDLERAYGEAWNRWVAGVGGDIWL